ncbi:MAG: transglutaminase-like domain-containing protein [Prevotellaceae bacterium]|jgi:regulator of sirC expression with transglutaminase-like and TPR domain|nr:transglutaminase-like domain-containing protein [Prevotellaceae bacterium]
MQREVSSLISLLDDSDSEVALAVMSRLCSKGEEIIPDLERAWQGCLEALPLGRIEQVIAQIQTGGTLQKLREWVDGGATDLFRGAYCLAKLVHYDVAYEPLAKTFDDVCNAIRIELNSNLTALEKVAVINHVLFDAYKFRNNASWPNHSPELFLIDNLLQNKMGNSAALSTLYLCIAKSLKLPIQGLTLPYGSLLAYIDEYRNDGSTLFYIYPFFHGQVLDTQQVELILNRGRVEENERRRNLYSSSNRAYVCQLAKLLWNIFVYTEQHNRIERGKMEAAIKILSR